LYINNFSLPLNYSKIWLWLKFSVVALSDRTWKACHRT
jgi:hypothetical protein